MYLRLLTSMLLFLAACSMANAQRSLQETIDQVENHLYPAVMITEQTPSTIRERMQRWHVPGMSVAVIDKKGIAWAKGYGCSSAEHPGGLVDTATLFQCASIGKIITAVAALHLVMEGKIGLDEDVNQKLVHWQIPESPYTATRKVTLRMLLSHSAGLTDNYGFAGYAPHTPLPSLLQILTATAPANNKKKLTVDQVPGSSVAYSGGGYLIIQQLIGDLVQMPFEAYVTKTVFKPFAMLHTTYEHYPDDVLRMPVARAHKDNGDPYAKFRYRVYPEAAAAGPWTTPTDLCRLIIGLQQIWDGAQSPVLSRQLLDTMLSPVLDAMGLGVNLKGNDRVVGFWHSGNNEGYTGVLMSITATGQGAVVLTNANSGEWLALEMLRSIAMVYDWPLQLSLQPLVIDSMEKYCGDFVLQDKGFLKVYREKDGLFFKRNGKGKAFRLYKISDGSFRIAEKPDNMSFVFVTDEKGIVTGLTMYENAGQVLKMIKRIPE